MKFLSKFKEKIFNAGSRVINFFKKIVVEDDVSDLFDDYIEDDISDLFGDYIEDDVINDTYNGEVESYKEFMESGNLFKENQQTGELYNERIIEFAKYLQNKGFDFESVGYIEGFYNLSYREQLEYIKEQLKYVDGFGNVIDINDLIALYAHDAIAFGTDNELGYEPKSKMNGTVSKDEYTGLTSYEKKVMAL